MATRKDGLLVVKIFLLFTSCEALKLVFQKALLLACNVYHLETSLLVFSAAIVKFCAHGCALLCTRSKWLDDKTIKWHEHPPVWWLSGCLRYSWAWNCGVPWEQYQQLRLWKTRDNMRDNITGIVPLTKGRRTMAVVALFQLPSDSILM